MVSSGFNRNNVTTGQFTSRSPFTSVRNLASYSPYSSSSKICGTGTTVYPTSTLTLYRTELLKYDKLRELVVGSLKLNAEYMRDGGYDQLDSSFTEEEVLRMGQLLAGTSLETFSALDVSMFVGSGGALTAYPPSTDLTNPTDPGFSTYKSFMFAILDGIQASILVHNENERIKALNADLATYRDILLDLPRLKQYIEDNYENFDADTIAVEQTVSTSFVMKLEYKLYFERHGVPSNGVMEQEKLSAIILELTEAAEEEAEAEA